MSSQGPQPSYESETADPMDTSGPVSPPQEPGQEVPDAGSPSSAPEAAQPAPLNLEPEPKTNALSAEKAQLLARYHELKLQRLDQDIETTPFQRAKTQLQIRNVELKLEVLANKELLRENQKQAEWREEQIAVFNARLKGRIGDAELKAWILRQDPRRFE